MRQTYQLPVVEIALAGARMPRGVISAGYNLQSEGIMSAQYLKYHIGLHASPVPCHTEPSHSEERVKDKEENSGHDSRRGAGVRSSTGKDRHRHLSQD